MRNTRRNSLSPLHLEGWEWEKFLLKVIHELSAFHPEEYAVSNEFLDKEGTYGSIRNPTSANISSWACKTTKLRQVRAACLQTSSCTSVFNLLISPLTSFELPFFGADFVTLPSGHLLLLDFQPVLKYDQSHIERVWERLLPLHNRWQSLLPWGGPLPEDAKSFFSPYLLWTRLPLGTESEHLIFEVLLPAYCEYLALYLDLVKEAKSVSLERTNLLIQGQKNYMFYRAEKDPARGMLSRFFGREWTESYIHNFLFDL